MWYFCTMPLANEVMSKMQNVFERYPDILAVYLFGSRATGTARPDSDYDLAVVTPRGRSVRDRKLDLLSDLAGEGIDNVDMSFLDGDNTVLEHEAVRLNQVVYCRPEFDRGSFFSRVMRLYFDSLPMLAVQRQALKERLLRGTA